ncbi:MAG: hypothetical protein RMA76_22570 [Deltaproteobacteria bacterium]|jgi:hypothetical protein
MRYALFIIGFGLVLVGGAIGYVGDMPINNPAYTSLSLMAIGGVMLAFGVAVLLLTGAVGSSDEDGSGKPEGFIRP